MKLKVLQFGLACGIIWGAMLAIIIFVNILTGDYALTFLTLVEEIYVVVDTTTYVGIITGAIVGFIDAFIGGIIFAWLYNLLAKK